MATFFLGSGRWAQEAGNEGSGVGHRLVTRHVFVTRQR
jgi:hypothetical protein